MGLFRKLYDHLEEVSEVYERDHTMTEEDYIHPGCLLKKNIMKETEWMTKAGYPLSRRMAVDQISLDDQRWIDGNTYVHKEA